MKRKIMIFCVIISLLFAFSSIAFAKEFDQSKVGSISVSLIDQKQNKSIVGAELSVYYVATVILDDNGNLIYEYTKEFEQFDTAIDDESLASNLDVFISQYSVPSVKMTTNEDGVAVCNKLSLGLYFVRQTGAVEGYACCTPFLVTIPNEENGEYLYDVDASPKTEVARLTSITIKKEWNTDKSTEAAKNVKIQLLKDGNVIKTATLSNDNNWQITYTDMPESDSYSVKEINVPKGFTATYKQNGYVFTVINTSTLIQTGQVMWPISLLAMGGLILISIGVVLLQRKRETNA